MERKSTGVSNLRRGKRNKKAGGGLKKRREMLLGRRKGAEKTRMTREQDA